ncbi:hypothetical protein [Burkholderia gladioli]|uniref:hypothetical protein n=1 Tax=Burkholderia gladioli TaxID=28095 RepID=UPI003D1DCD2D
MSVLMFPGQGSQAKGMGEALFDRYPELTAAADGILGYSIRALCVDDPERRPQRHALHATRALRRQRPFVPALPRRGRRRAGLAGRPQASANTTRCKPAGAVSFEDGPAPGRAARRADEHRAERRDGRRDRRRRGAHSARCCARPAWRRSTSPISIRRTRRSCPDWSPISRAPNARFDGIARYVPLNTSGAFHSRYMDAARREFETFLSEIRFTTPAIPVIANVDARPYPGDDIAARLARQITHSVQWTRTIQTLLATGETDYVEIGPGQVLTRLVAEIPQASAAGGRRRPAVLPAATGLAAEARNPGHESARESAHESAHDATHEAAPRYDRAALLQDRAAANQRLEPPASPSAPACAWIPTTPCWSRARRPFRCSVIARRSTWRGTTVISTSPRFGPA